MAKSVLLFILSSIYLLAAGQSVFSKFEIGLNAGVFVYQGDLTPSQFGSYKTLKPGLSLFVKQNSEPAIFFTNKSCFRRIKGRRR